MTDNEIKKALEEVKATLVSLEDNGRHYVSAYLSKESLEICKNALYLVNCKQAEIEQWKKEANRYQNLYCVSEEDAVKAKSEAVKEFAGLFKARLRDVARGEIGGCTYYMIGEFFIDKIVKEMAGDTE